MADGLNTPVGETAAKKMTLSPKERELILAHRARTAGDREWNAALDEAVAVVLRTNINPQGIDLTDEQFDKIQRAIRAAKREV